MATGAAGMVPSVGNTCARLSSILSLGRHCSRHDCKVSIGVELPLLLLMQTLLYLPAVVLAYA